MADTGGRRVLITGVAGGLAGRLAARLGEDDRVDAIVGIDLRVPAHDLGRAEFVQADLRQPDTARLVGQTGADTVAHCSVLATPAGAGGRARMKELNVIGTMQLLGAAQKAPRLRRVVVKSTTAVYGSQPADPALFREDDPLVGTPSFGYHKDAVEIEGYARAFARRRPGVGLTLLRYANLIGPTLDTALTGYLSLPAVPTVAGHDPRLQLCHEDDAAEVLYRAVMGAAPPGTYNVAGPGIVYLSQALRLAGRPTVPVASPFVHPVAGMVRRTGRVDFSADQLALLLYGRVGDITRLRTEFGYAPTHTTRQALDSFVAAGRVAPLVDRTTAARWEADLARLLTRGAGLARRCGSAGRGLARVASPRALGGRS